MVARRILSCFLYLVLPSVIPVCLHAQSSGIIGFRRLSVNDGRSQSTVNHRPVPADCLTSRNIGIGK
jgi:hypothetical protein